MSNEERASTEDIVEEFVPDVEASLHDDFADEVENAGEPDEIYLGERPGADAPAADEGDGYKDRYVRLLAEFDNYRKRSQRDLTLERQRGRRDAAEKLLSAYDSLAIGLFTMKDADSAVRSGMEAVASQVLAAFEALGIQKLETEGEPFDPALHEAIAHLPHESVPEGHVMNESRAGFADSVGLLRPAQVVVSSGPAAG